MLRTQLAWTNGWTDGRTDGRFDFIMPPKEKFWGHKKSKVKPDWPDLPIIKMKLFKQLGP